METAFGYTGCRHLSGNIFKKLSQKYERLTPEKRETVDNVFSPYLFIFKLS